MLMNHKRSQALLIQNSENYHCQENEKLQLDKVLEMEKGFSNKSSYAEPSVWMDRDEEPVMYADVMKKLLAKQN